MMGGREKLKLWMFQVNAVENKVQTGNNLLSSFWSHPVTRTAADMSEFLKSCTYQLSSPSPSKSFFTQTH